MIMEKRGKRGRERERSDIIAMSSLTVSPPIPLLSYKLPIIINSHGHFKINKDKKE